jgi:hypothetical protein
MGTSGSDREQRMQQPSGATAKLGKSSIPERRQGHNPALSPRASRESLPRQIPQAPRSQLHSRAALGSTDSPRYRRAGGAESRRLASSSAPASASNATAMPRCTNHRGRVHHREALPNRSLNRTRYGKAPRPRGVHCLSCTSRPGHLASARRLASLQGLPRLSSK